MLFELGGGLLENVFLIFSFPSASVDKTSPHAAFYWSQIQQAERPVNFSSFSLSFIPPFSSSMHLFYCLPQFPSCNNHYFSFCPYLFFFYFFFTSPLSLVPPLLLARLSFFSLPHFLCALQWFFRFFPSYTLFPCLSLSIQPNACLAPL